MQKCERCRLPGTELQGSMFNTENICKDCQTEERAHPDYYNASSEMFNALMDGDASFTGIGLPSSLRAQAENRRRRANAKRRR